MTFVGWLRQVLPFQPPPRSAPILPEAFDVTALAGELDLASLEIVRAAPAWLTRGERLFLFAFVFGLRPARYLEIGTLEGGSALIVAAAMDASASPGKMVCVEPNPRIAPEHWKRIEHRATLLQGYSPDVLPRARDLAGGAFDLVFIDGDHTSRGVRRDANGVLPFVNQGGYILFHDSFSLKVARALDEFVAEHASQILDCGIVTREATSQVLPSSEKILWGGLRMMRKCATIGAR